MTRTLRTYADLVNKVTGRAWPWWAETLMICVVGAGTVPQAYGLIGLAERVAALNGHLE